MRDSHFLPHIDALRGLAILLVLFYHIDVPYFQGGFVGVDVFFVISGYLITRIVVGETQENRFSLAQFYARRIKRIFPAFFTVLLATFIGALIFLPPVNFTEFLNSLTFTSAQLSNYFFYSSFDYFRQGTLVAPLLHTWTLGVEAQFYLLWAILCVLVLRVGNLTTLKAVILLLGIVSFGISDYLVEENRMAAFYLLPSRIWEFIVGGLLALRMVPAIGNNILAFFAPVLGIGLILWCGLYFDDAAFPGRYALLPCLGAALIIHSAQDRMFLAHRLFSNKIMTGTGLISYSLYLWHWPLVSLYKSYFDLNLSPTAQISIAALSFALAFLSWKFVERPFQAMRVAPKRVIGCGLLTVLAFLLLSAFAAQATQGRIARAPAADPVETATNEYYKVCGKKGGVYRKDECLFGPDKENYQVILAGDSHALHYAPTVVEWAKKHGLTVRLFVQGGCQTFVKKYSANHRKCSDLSDYFLQTLEEDKSIKIVFLALKEPDEHAERSIARIEKYNKKIIYLGRVPMFRQSPHNCRMRKNTIASEIWPTDEKSCLSLDKDFSAKEIELTHGNLKRFLAEEGIAYFDPVPYLFVPFDEEGHFKYMDQHHLNYYGSLSLIDPLDSFLQKNGVK
jgi:peptidoglycan/LPS O-acetylase OafA/YrhL